MFNLQGLLPGGPRRAMRLRPRILSLLVVLGALGAPAAAHASGADVVRDCTDDGQLSKSYTGKEIANALANLPADVDEYSDCRDVIRRAQLALAGKGSKGSDSGSGAGGGATGGGGAGTGGAGTGGDAAAAPAAPGADPLATATPLERASYEKAIADGAAPIMLDGRPITPGTLGGARDQELADLPTSLIVVLALLALGGVGALAAGTRHLVLGRRTA